VTAFSAITGWSSRFALLILGLVAAVIIVGATQLNSVSVDAVPEFNPPFVEVQTEALGLSAEEVEQLITVPLEADLLNGVAWLDSIHSRSISGLSSITLTFEPGTDVMRARQMVSERLTQAHALPNVSRPPVMLEPMSSASRVMMIGIASDDLSLIEQSVLARWTLRPRLLGVPGVANVAIWGQRERQLQVLVDPARLSAHETTLEDIIKTTGNSLWVSPLTFLEASTPGTGGFIETPNQRLGVQHVLPITSATDLGRVVVERDDAAAGDATLRLRDVADVVEDHQPLIGDAIIDGQPGLLLVVEKFPNANTLEVTAALDAALDALAPGLPGIELDRTVYRPAEYVTDAMVNVALAAAIGFLLAFAVLAILLYSLRAAVVAGLGLAAAMVVGALVLHLLGVTFNVVVLTGLALALAVVVDDMVTAVHETLYGPADTAVFDARRLGAYALVIALIAIVPAFFIPGEAHAFAPALAGAYAVAAVASTAVVLTVVPALSRLLLSADGERRRSPARAWLVTRYRTILQRLVDRRRSALGFATAVTIGVVALSAISLAPRADGSLLPEFRERALLIDVHAPPGTSRGETSRLLSGLIDELQAVEGVANVGAHIGRAILSDQVVGVDSAQVWVSLSPDADASAVSGVRLAIESYPGIDARMMTYGGRRIETVLGRSGEDLVVRVYGNDAAVLDAKAGEIVDAAAGIDGVASVERRATPTEPALEIEVDIGAAERYGVTPGDVRRSATTLLSGIEVGALFEDQKVFEVVVWGAPQLRADVNSIGNLLIDTPSGEQVPLSAVADVRVVDGPSVIEREGVARYADIAIGTSGRSLDEVAADLRSAIAAVEFPLEHYAELMAPAQARAEEMMGLALALLAALAALLLVLQAAFESWRLAGLALLTLPAAASGGAVAALITGAQPSLGMVMGFAVVIVLAARSSAVMLAQLRTVESGQGETPTASAVLNASADRVLPILTSALAAGACLLPFAVLGDRAGLELLGPLAVVALGGLLSTVLVSLLVIPPAYLGRGADADRVRPSLPAMDGLPGERQPVATP
jgi:Cu/Ag efflux pump CusA